MKNDNEQALEKLGAFEISSEMKEIAKQNEHGNNFLNAGRGNPNWIQTQSRLAFARLTQFGVHDSRRAMDQGQMAGYLETTGVFQRLKHFLQPENRSEDRFIITAIDYCHRHYQLSGDELVAEWVNGILGNDYPDPDRCLSLTEVILNHYLKSIAYHDDQLLNQTQLFPTEGATAAIAYAFNSLKENHLLSAGDKIAINTPIFPPYLQIPVLNDYELVEVDIRSYEKNNWEVNPREIEKLTDPAIKAFIVVNPTNPGSKAFNEKDLAAIRDVVRKRPDLMIISDEVYGTFVPHFHSVYQAAPHNTMLVYSFSKLYGCTGWRLGLVALNKENVFDDTITRLPQYLQQQLQQRYRSVVLHPDKMKFIDRLCADSRSIGLYHTAGLSTPQQIMAVLFAMSHLITQDHDGGSDSYIDQTRQLISARYEKLHNAMGAPKDESDSNTHYYSLIDIYGLAEQRYGHQFREYLADNFEQVDFLLKLAEKSSVVLVDGVGFGTKPGELRVSEANLPTKDYQVIGQHVLELLADYHQQFEQAQKS
ncbi:bifunctional aspartate transaminase/aspartate 4-decarboxylase [uncultured Limosilactobacillus sp.]|uniref:bifunctional aspartate transaminase/aspartate 4-decarboxylase n=1 Tax=uncultured Limosilactobacillus sp. TaxID=2837629 RepID=UPI0025F9932A|nr:bifunctional aspartate transaminase/aspartate 4-decarboxylase [uncultured Limosilactobacillus sp.]